MALHAARTFAADVAGNTGVSHPFQFTTQNDQRPNGTGATRFAKLTASFRDGRGARTTSTVRYGRTRTVVGRLTGSDGAPIGGAQIDVASTHLRTGADTTACRPDHDRSGRALRLPRRVRAVAIDRLQLPGLFARSGKCRHRYRPTPGPTANSVECHPQAFEERGAGHVPRQIAVRSWARRRFGGPIRPGWRSAVANTGRIYAHGQGRTVRASIPLSHGDWTCAVPLQRTDSAPIRISVHRWCFERDASDCAGLTRVCRRGRAGSLGDIRSLCDLPALAAAGGCARRAGRRAAGAGGRRSAGGACGASRGAARRGVG